MSVLVYELILAVNVIRMFYPLFRLNQSEIQRIKCVNFATLILQVHYIYTTSPFFSIVIGVQVRTNANCVVQDGNVVAKGIISCPRLLPKSWLVVSTLLPTL